VAVPFGVLIGALTIRLGNLYVALVTLTVGLLFDDLVFSQQVFVNFGIGVNVNLPSFASSTKAFTYLTLGVFAVISLLIVNLRRSTTGLALNAARWSTPGSKTMGISVLQMKVLVAGIAAFVAGVGGAMFALSLGSALPTNYSTLGGLVWLAILVSLGIRSNMAALMAGLSATLLAGIALVYLPSAFGQVTPILFGLGAIQVAKFPNGVMTENARQVLWVWDKLRNRSRPVWTSEVDRLEASVPADTPNVLVGAEAATTVVGGDAS
jgi:branched-chain amino acid transport system permease protein